MTEEAEEENEIEVRIEPEPSTNISCGCVSDMGGGLPGLSERVRRKTGCYDDATNQVFVETDPPEHATIVGACDEHLEEAKAFAKQLSD